MPYAAPSASRLLQFGTQPLPRRGARRRDSLLLRSLPAGHDAASEYDPAVLDAHFSARPFALAGRVAEIVGVAALDRRAHV